MSKKSLRLTFLSFCIIVFNVFSLNHAQSNVTDLPDGVSIYQLSNGLEVMLIEKPSLPMVGINTVVKVGSAYENFATSGMSHMLEHLLFNGTSTMTQKELYDSTDIIGGYNNANTGEYYTNYMMVTPAENIIDGMKLQSAMLFDSVIPMEKFEKEKGIVLEEIAKSMAKSNDQIERNIISTIYDGHALSLPTLGTYSTIENMERDDVYAFYKNYYNPNNMIVSVIGNFNSAEMLENIKEIYGKAKPGIIKSFSNSNLSAGFDNVENYNAGKVFHRFYKGENTLLQLFFEIEQPSNIELFDVLQIILDERSEKLKAELVEKYGEMVKDVEFTIRNYPTINYIQVTLILNDDDDLTEIHESLWNLLSKLKFEIANETLETEAVKARTKFLKNVEKPHMFGIYNAYLFAGYGIESILSFYSGTGFKNSKAELEAFQLSKYYITIVQHPQKESETSVEKSESEIKVFDGKDGKAQLIAKESRGSDLLAIHYLIKNKALFESKYGKNAAKIWHDAFGNRMKKSEVQKMSSKFGFTFTVNDNPYIPMDNIYLSPEFGYIRVEGLADSIEESIKFLNTQMLTFIPTEEEFEQAKGKSTRPTMMGHGNKAKDLFENKLNSILYEESPYETQSAELTYENLLAFGKEYFIPSNMIISVVSSANSEDIKNYFSNFSNSVIAENNSAFLKELKTINESIKIDMTGGGEQSYLYYGFQKLINEEDLSALMVLSLLLSDEIVFDLREKQGLAYRMKAGIEIVKDKAMFYINMGTRPENVEKLIPQFPTFFNTEIINKVTSSTIRKSVNMYLGRMMFRRLSSINQAYYLGHSQYFYNDIKYDSKILDGIKNVTKYDIERVINKYLDPAKVVEIYVR